MPERRLNTIGSAESSVVPSAKRIYSLSVNLPPNMSRADDRPPIFPTKRAEQSSALISSDKHNTLTPFLAALSAICKASADFPTAGLAPMMCKPPLMKPPPSNLSNLRRPEATQGTLPPTCSETRYPSCVIAAVSVCESPRVFPRQAAAKPPVRVQARL